MLYQLPDGRVVYLTVEQYLDMSDADIQNLMASNYGDHISIWQHSVIKSPTKQKTVDNSIDYEEESDEVTIKVTTTIALITVDDIDPTESGEDLEPNQEEED